MLISKDGINHLLDTECYGPKIFFLIRFLALLDTLLFTLSLPFMMVIYTVIFIVSTLILVVAFPIWISLFIWYKLSTDENYIRDKLMSIYTLFWPGFICTLISVLVMVSLLLLTPIYIIAPEFPVRILKIHKWGPLV